MTQKLTATDFDFREKAIPSMEGAATALNYHDVEIDLSRPESAEPLVNARDFNLVGHSYYARVDKLNPPYYISFKSALEDIFLREGVARKLNEVNERLGKYAVELVLIDCYRPIELQKEVWQHFLARARDHLENPTDKECVEYAGQFCSNPEGFKIDDWKTWPVHTTGGACDLLLRSVDTKEYLFFGSVFDDSSEISLTDHFEKNEPKTSSEFEARRNRRLLYWAMTASEFVNYPYEWWHFDLGTQMWIMNGSEKNDKAYYGYIESPV